MPELPEVETTRRGIEPHVAGETVCEVVLRRRDLRFPIPESVAEIEGARLLAVRRRSKYLLFEVSDGSSLLVHLGMSGSLRVMDPAAEWKKHDHVGLTLGNGRQLRFHDPRRFGLLLHHRDGQVLEHPLLRALGPEPLEAEFTAAFLRQACARRMAPIKQVIMDAKVVVGVGNIYASEALFRAGIRPEAVASKISLARLEKLVQSVRAVLSESIEQGGTTLRDFLRSDGAPGYFKQRLQVYGRTGEACRVCGAAVRHAVTGQRSTYWCARCQR